MAIELDGGQDGYGVGWKVVGMKVEEGCRIKWSNTQSCVEGCGGVWRGEVRLYNVQCA
jgi:hypothetical protein